MSKISKTKLQNLKQGQLIKVPFNKKILDAIIIDPNGLAEGQPSLGMGFRMMSKHGGLTQSNLSRWVMQINDQNHIKLPSGNAFRVMQIVGSDGNTYSVVEVTDWVKVAADIIKKPGKVSKSTIHKVVDFLAWFAVDGFYAQAYTIAGFVYGDSTRRHLEKWKQERIIGVPLRKEYATYLVDIGEHRLIGKWTNIVYQGLFGHNASTMKKIWETQAGRKDIARNHIPESVGIEAVAHCEKLVVVLDLNEIKESHTQAISLTKAKFAI